MSRLWTPEENAKLAELRAGIGSMKELSSLIPGRTATACIVHASKYGMGARHHKQYAARFSWIEVVVETALENSSNKTVQEIADLTGASYAGCHRVLKKWHGERFHISGWTRRKSTERWTAKWSAGDGEDVRKPGRITSVESKRRRREFAKLKEQANNPFAIAMNQVMQEAA